MFDQSFNCGSDGAPLGGTGVHVSRLGLGTAPFGGMYAPVDEVDALAAVREAYAAGIRYFDTAPYYGYGLAERYLGAALAELPRSDVTLSTKVGRLVTPAEEADSFFVGARGRADFDFSRCGVRRSIEASLERLGVERFDILLIHDPDEHYSEAVEGAYPALWELREAGQVGAIGVGMNQVEGLARFLRDTDIDCVLLAGRYTLLDQVAAGELLPLCRRRGVGVVIGGVFNGGVLADPRPGASFDYAPAGDEVLTRALRLREVCARHGVPLPAAAMRFSGAHPAVSSVLVGCRSAAEVRTNVEFATVPIPDELWDELRAEGLLPEDAVTPKVAR